MNCSRSVTKKYAVDLLKADHRKVEELFMQFEHSCSASSRQQILNQIIKGFPVHAKVEESLVYSLLEDSRKTAEGTAEACEEHHIVKMMLAELAAIPASDDVVKAKLKVRREIVRDYVKDEEMSLLPQLRRSGTELEGLAVDVKRRNQQLMSSIARSGAVAVSKDRTAIASSDTAIRAKLIVKKSTDRRKVSKPNAKRPTKLTSLPKTASKKVVVSKTGARAWKKVA